MLTRFHVTSSADSWLEDRRDTQLTTDVSLSLSSNAEQCQMYSSD